MLKKDFRKMQKKGIIIQCMTISSWRRCRNYLGAINALFGRVLMQISVRTIHYQCLLPFLPIVLWAGDLPPTISYVFNKLIKGQKLSFSVIKQNDACSNTQYSGTSMMNMIAAASIQCWQRRRLRFRSNNPVSHSEESKLRMEE